MKKILIPVTSILLVIFLFCNDIEAIAQENMQCINKELIYKKYGLAGVRCYFPNGVLKIEASFNKNRHGIEKTYYENGILATQCPLKYGVKSGICKMYSEAGNLFNETHFKNDKQEGVSKFYDENGKLVLEMLFSNSNAVSGKCANGKTLTSTEINTNLPLLWCD